MSRPEGDVWFEHPARRRGAAPERKEVELGETLAEALARLGTARVGSWQHELDARKVAELEFHDRDRDEKARKAMSTQEEAQRFGNRRFYRITDLSAGYVDGWLAANARDKVFLDYACGNGASAIRAAELGASLAIGIDISPVSLENARRTAAKAGLEARTCFVQADAEDTTLPSDSVDVVLCSGVLHHLDLSYAFPELRRILRPGGKVLAVEALGYNPLIALYRRMTPQMRTAWERRHILRFNDVRFAGRFFRVGDIRCWHIAAVLGAYVPRMLKCLNAIDCLATRIPVVRLMAWMFTFELTKASSDDKR